VKDSTLQQYGEYIEKDGDKWKIKDWVLKLAVIIYNWYVNLSTELRIIYLIN
jgi:hypothetical protein